MSKIPFILISIVISHISQTQDIFGIEYDYKIDRKILGNHIKFQPDLKICFAEPLYETKCNDDSII